MFVIVYNNNVILGPMRWNRFRFQNEIFEECEVSCTLPNRNDLLEPITVAENIKILPTLQEQDPPYNSRIETLHGPFWTFTETHAVSRYEVMPMTIDAVKSQLIAETAAERWRRESAGVKVTVQNTEVTVDTSRGARDRFVQKYLLMGDTEVVQWKFPERWLSLSKSDLGLVVTASTAYVQAQFDWESAKITEITDCTTLEALANVEITPPKSPESEFGVM